VEEFMTQYAAGFNGSYTSDLLTMICFAALPVGFMLGWGWTTWRSKKRQL
jgi:hypothetical protein